MASSSDITSVIAVGNGGRSVRTVIPLWVAQQLNIKAGDKINWNLKVEKGEIIAHIKGVK